MTDATQVAGTDVPKYKARWDLLFVVPGKTSAQDGVKEHLETGELFGMYSGDTVDEMKERTGAVLKDADEFITESEKAMTTDPVEITDEQFMDALEVLPPYGWEHRPSQESFYMSEFYSGDVTTFYVRLNKRHYSFMAPLGRGETQMDHAARVKKVQDWLDSLGDNPRGTGKEWHEYLEEKKVGLKPFDFAYLRNDHTNSSGTDRIWAGSEAQAREVIGTMEREFGIVLVKLEEGQVDE